MLGSCQPAEDALQDTLLAAWQGLGGFEGRGSPPPLLFPLAPHPRRQTRAPPRPTPPRAPRRAGGGHAPRVPPPAPPGRGEAVWLEPFPDALLTGAIDVTLGPE